MCEWVEAEEQDIIMRVWADAQIICHHGNQGYNRFITFSPLDANEENHHGNNDQDNTKG